jgi:DNA-binding FadR family transcriptional regulator
MSTRIKNEAGKATRQGQQLVQIAAAKLRELILDQEPETQIGSLREVAAQLGVGIVTVQQAARILEHEGLLAVRRGPGGGYYGTRPDEAVLERMIAAYIRVHGSAYLEAREMMSLLNCELAAAAANCTQPELHKEMRALLPHIDSCDTEELRIAWETDLHALLCRMADRPVVALLSRVTMRLHKNTPIPTVFPGEAGVMAWKQNRCRLIQAILQQDEELARFEAMRNRAHLLRSLRT